MRPADTTVEAQQFQWSTYAALTVQQRIESLNDICKGLSTAGREQEVKADLQEFLLGIARRLDSAGIPYMVVGSVAAGIWAAPRYTQDVDLVIKADESQADELARSFADNFYVGDLVTAARTLDMANVIDPTTGWKADFIWAKQGDWDDMAFSRRVSVRIADRSITVATAEDVVIAKLRWARSSESEMQLRDVSNLLGVVKVDWEYLQRWVHELGLEGLLARAQE